MKEIPNAFKMKAFVSIGDNARREKIMGVKKMLSRTTFECCQFQLIVYCFSMFSVAL